MSSDPIKDKILFKDYFATLPVLPEISSRIISINDAIYNQIQRKVIPFSDVKTILIQYMVSFKKNNSRNRKMWPNC